MKNTVTKQQIDELLKKSEFRIENKLWELEGYALAKQLYDEVK